MVGYLTYSIVMKVKNGLRQRDLERQNAENNHKITITLSTHKLNNSSTIQCNIDKSQQLPQKYHKYRLKKA